MPLRESFLTYLLTHQFLNCISFIINPSIMFLASVTVVFRPSISSWSFFSKFLVLVILLVNDLILLGMVFNLFCLSPFLPSPPPHLFPMEPVIPICGFLLKELRSSEFSLFWTKSTYPHGAQSPGSCDTHGERPACLLGASPLSSGPRSCG